MKTPRLDGAASGPPPAYAPLAARARSLFALGALVAAASCAGGAGKSAPRLGHAAAPSPGPPPPFGPARYALTEERGVVWDEAPPTRAVPGVQPAILDGQRLLLDRGLIVGARAGPEALTGFRTLPQRLGGGVVAWSEGRTYRADRLLGELRPIVDVGAIGGARPWLTGVLLRTERGVLELDPKTLAVRREPTPGLADALALDERRGIAIDLLGRAATTIDGGRTFADATKETGIVVTGLRSVDGAIALEAVGGGDLVFDGAIGPAPPPPPSTSAKPSHEAEVSPDGRALASSSLALAMVAGAELPGGRVAVARERGVRVFSAETGQLLVDLELAGVGEAFSRCEPASVGGELLLACTHAWGAHVLALGDSLGDLRLEATLLGRATFVAGLGGRFGYAGRCGGEPPSRADFGLRSESGAGGAPESAEPTAEIAEGSLPGRAARAGEGPESARFCARVEPGRWVERTLTGDDARDLYRWVPGDDGVVTALVLRAPEGAGGRAAAPPEGVRVVRLDPADPALAGASYVGRLARPDAALTRAIDRDAWQDASSAAIHTWIALPAPGEIPRARGALAPARGRVAGVEIAPDGRLTVHPLPPEIAEVVVGGPFAIARGELGAAEITLESIDGGRSWRPVSGPPVGGVAPESDDVARGCSVSGCSWGDGVVRLGWGAPGGSSPSPVPEQPAPAANPRPPPISSLAVACRVEAPSRASARARARGAPILLHVGAGLLGELRGDAWSADVAPPFQPAAPPEHVELAGASERWLYGDVLPLLRSGSAGRAADLALHLEHRWIELGAGAPASFDLEEPLTALAELTGGKSVGYEAGSGAVVLVEAGVARQVVKLARAPDVSRLRLTLGRRLDRDALELVAYSATSGEILAGALELGRAEVGPLAPIGELSRAEDARSPACSRGRATHRFVAELSVALSLGGPGGPGAAPSVERPALALLEIRADRVCVTGLEIPLEEHEQLSFAAGPRGGAVVRGPTSSVRASCVVGR